MKIFKRVISLLLFTLVICTGINLSMTTANAEVNKVPSSKNSTTIQPLNGIGTYYRSYCFTKTGSACNPAYYDKYWRSDALSIIWSASGSWKGYVLNDSNGSNSVSNCGAVVLSNEAGYYPINIDFSTAYYQIAQGDPKNNTEYVKGVQQALLWLGYNIGPAGVDGDFGYSTGQAVVAFQKNHGLTQDGVVGKNTYWALSQANN